MEYFKQLLIRTPVEKPAKKIQSLLSFRQRIQHPEMHEIWMEPYRIEQVMERIISNSSNCIDIGVHLGSMLSTIVQLSPRGSHMAFEPIPYKARWLKQKFPEVNVREIALSDTCGETTFYINTSRSGFSGLQPHNCRKNERLEKITVERERLDNLINPENQVDFIKVDVEGGELGVLRGAVETISRFHPTILFECTRSGLSCFGFTSKEIFEFFVQHSYSIFLLQDFLNDRKPLKFAQFDTALKYPFLAFNFIAVENLR